MTTSEMREVLRKQIDKRGGNNVLPTNENHPDSLFGKMPPKKDADTSDIDHVIRESKRATLERREDQ